MERLGPGAFEGFSVFRLEHEHRYRCAAATGAFEAFHANQYGINPHHRGKFLAPRLRGILAGGFSHIRIFIARVALAAGLYESDGKTGPLHGDTITERTITGDDYGSYFFVASNAALPPRLAAETGQLIIGGSYFAAEGQRMDRVLASNFADRAVAEVMAAKDRLVKERDVVISAHNDAMIEITKRVKSADALVQTQADQITDARQRLKDLAAGIQARDAEIEAWRDRHKRSLGVGLLRSWGRVTSLGFRGQDCNA
jgi:hypothetical protein